MGFSTLQNEGRQLAMYPRSLALCGHMVHPVTEKRFARSPVRRMSSASAITSAQPKAAGAVTRCTTFQPNKGRLYRTYQGRGKMTSNAAPFASAGANRGRCQGPRVGKDAHPAQCSAASFCLRFGETVFRTVPTEKFKRDLHSPFSIETERNGPKSGFQLEHRLHRVFFGASRRRPPTAEDGAPVDY